MVASSPCFSEDGHYLETTFRVGRSLYKMKRAAVVWAWLKFLQQNLEQLS